MQASRSLIILAVLAWASVASAQVRPADVQCKSTETQAECHARLKCKPNEELEDCQKRLLRCKAGEDMPSCVKRVQSAGSAGGGQPQSGGDNGERGNSDNDRGGRDNDSDRGGRDNDTNDRDGRDNDSDRGGRDSDRGSRDRSDRGRSRGSDRDSGRGRRQHTSGGRGFEANKKLGLGLELGEPTGLTGKVFLAKATALDFGVGWIYRHYYYGDGLHLYGDVLFHPVSLASNPTFELPLYIGGGLRYWDFNYCYQGRCNYGGSAIGIRIPFGISFDFNNVPLDIFAQLVPTIDFIRGNYYDRYRDRNHFGIDFSFGLRFWFK